MTTAQTASERGDTKELRNVYGTDGKQKVQIFVFSLSPKRQLFGYYFSTCYFQTVCNHVLRAIKDAALSIRCFLFLVLSRKGKLHVHKSTTSSEMSASIFTIIQSFARSEIRFYRPTL